MKQSIIQPKGSISMLAYELLPRLRHLTLVGQDEDGDLEFLGTEVAWEKMKEEERTTLYESI